ncbi:DUF3857 domain-containing protein [Flavilitoribacter nigricans]|nr:DUF3857 domain-containing protein [Flavilitoribacter nigricans]
MKNFVFVFCFLLSLTLRAQDPLMEFGSMSQDQINMISYDKAPDAPAVVLFDLGESYFYDFDGGYNIRFTRTRRVKIFDQSATDLAEVRIPFYADGYGKTERVASIEAFTYNFENGRPIKKAVAPTSIFEEQINERWRVKKFVFPDVKKGSVIEYRYVLETPFHFNLPDWTFQDKIPTLYSQYQVSMIPFYDYAYIAQGITEFDVKHSEEGKFERRWGNVTEAMGQSYGRGVKFKDLIHTYAIKDIPAFKDESYITSPNDYLMKIDFQLSRFYRPQGGSTDIITTWENLNESLLKNDHFGDFLKQSRKLTGKLLEKELDVSSLSEAEKAEKIIQYVKDNFSWNQTYGKYTSKSAKDLWSQKSGSAAELNLLLVAFLQEAGLKAEPLLISTRDHGKIHTEYPFEHFFNYVIAFVEAGQPFLADATSTALPFNRIPPRCMNELGLVVQEGKPVWLQLNSEITALENKQIQFKLDPDTRTATTTVSIQATEYEGYLYRTRFRDDEESLKTYFKGKGLHTVEMVRTSKYEEPDKPYIIGIKGTSEIEQIGSNLILSPFLDFPMQENLLRQEERTYPVDFIYPKMDQFRIILEIPEGYELTDAPKAFQESNELVEVNITPQQTATSLTINAHYHIKKSVYSPQEYQKIKGYLDLIIKQFNQQVVLQKS